MATETRNSEANQTIDGWIAGNLPKAKLEKLRSSPWAKTWRVEDGGEIGYLKHIRENGKARVIAAQSIAKANPKSVPPVLKANSDLAVMLVEDHGGTKLKDNQRTEKLHAVLSAYAQIQSRMAGKSKALAALPDLGKPESLMDDLLDFLGSTNEPAKRGSVRASHFMGAEGARHWHSVFAHIAPVLKPHLAKASLLPSSINHCDLRPSNMAERKDGSIAIIDWDDAIVGPIGLSLHAQFSGCIRPHLALTGETSANNTTRKNDRAALNAYIDLIAKGTKTSADTIKDNLSSAILAGTIVYLLNFASYPGTSSTYRKDVRRTITKRLGSIMDVCEHLIKDDTKTLKALSQCYFYAGLERRHEALEKTSPKPLYRPPALNTHAEEKADTDPKAFPTITFTDRERQAGLCTRANAKLGARMYEKHGTLLLKNTFDRSLIDECREHVLGNYNRYFEKKDHSDALRVGDKRYMVTLSMDGPINQPDLYAAPTIMPIIERLLSDRHIIGSIVGVVSLPGSKDQSLHRDHHALYPDHSIYPPPFCISLMIPLINMDEEVGATRLWKGTHLMPSDEGKKMPYQDPIAPVGSCFLMDYRVYHRGMGNKSDRVRPVMTIIYQRPWFRDYVNYDKNERMVIPENEYAKIPQEKRYLFDWK